MLFLTKPIIQLKPSLSTLLKSTPQKEVHSDSIPHQDSFLSYLSNGPSTWMSDTAMMNTQCTLPLNQPTVLYGAFTIVADVAVSDLKSALQIGCRYATEQRDIREWKSSKFVFPQWQEHNEQHWLPTQDSPSETYTMARIFFPSHVSLQSIHSIEDTLGLKRHTSSVFISDDHSLLLLKSKKVYHLFGLTDRLVSNACHQCKSFIRVHTPTFLSPSMAMEEMLIGLLNEIEYTSDNFEEKDWWSMIAARESTLLSLVRLLQ
ncbi:hypothetical protein F4703DRAFT_1822587 [Phycomyces blakesleeanus]